MQAPQDVKKNFIALVSEAAEEQRPRPARSSSDKSERKGLFGLIAAAWSGPQRPE